MMRFWIMLTLALAAVGLLSCSDSDDNSSVNSPQVLFSVTVHDSSGNPVPGLRVGSINHGSSTKSAPAKPCPDTQIDFSIPEAADYQLTIFNYHDTVVKIFAGHAEAGTHTIIWDGTDENGDYIAGGFYRMRLVTGNFEDEKWFIYDWGNDPYHTILGTLDANGSFASDDIALFPGLIALPPVDYYRDTVTIHISDSAFPDDFFMKKVKLSPSGNGFSFTYDSLGLPSAKVEAGR